LPAVRKGSGEDFRGSQVLSVGYLWRAPHAVIMPPNALTRFL
jgi:hypothetical protein